MLWLTPDAWIENVELTVGVALYSRQSADLMDLDDPSDENAAYKDFKANPSQ